jgi:flagellar motility protein MotE (MotC chaperone)
MTKPRFKPSLLLLMAGAAGLSVLAHGATVAAGPAEPAPATRMGVSIKQAASDRDSAAARRDRALDLREQAARATEARIKADLEARQSEPQKAGGKPAEEEEDQFESLARIYQTMKPAKAAKVFEQLDMDVQVSVAQRMRDRSTALILASMSPEGAAKLSMALARQDARGGRKTAAR